MIDFSRLLSWPYWINKNPFTISQEFLYGWLIVTTILLVFGIAVRVWASRNNDIATQWVSWYYRISRLLVTVAIFSYVLVWFRYERIPLFSARAWMLALLLVGLVWAIMIWRQRNAIREAVEKRQIVQKLEKFLPKKKK
jgi:hypothetical protein